jgi:hypothetical protein
MANRYWVGGTATWDNTAGTKWATTSGGAGGSTAPTAADDVFFDNKPAQTWTATTVTALGVLRTPVTGNGLYYECTTAGTTGAAEPTWPTTVGNTVVDGTVTWTCRASTVTTAATAICLSVTFNTFSGTLNAATNWTVLGSLTFSSTMTITGTGNIIKTGNGGTWTSNGKTYTGGITFTPSSFSFSSNFADNWTIVGSLTRTGANAYTITGSGGVRTISVQGSFTGGSLTLSSMIISMTGTGSLSGLSLGGSGTTPTIEINTSGIISHNAQLGFNGITFTYISGTFNSTATLGCGSNTSTFNNWGDISRAFFAFDWAATLGGQSVTLNSDIYITNNLTFTGNAGGNFTGAGRTVFIYGSISGSGNLLGGTATIQMAGSSNASITIGSIQNNLNINKTSPAVLTLNSFTWGATGRTLSLTQGSLNLGMSTITIADVSSVTINNMTFWNLTIPGGVNLPIITQNVLNTIQNNLTFGATASVIFAGTAGWTCANLICTTPGRTITLQNSITYTTTTNVNFIGTATLPITMISNSGTVRAIWTLTNPATQTMAYVQGTRIDSSGGLTIYPYGRTPIDSPNWFSLSPPGTVAYTFVN